MTIPEVFSHNSAYLTPSYTSTVSYIKAVVWKIAAVTTVVAFSTFAVICCMNALTTGTITASIIVLTLSTPLVSSIYQKMIGYSFHHRFISQYKNKVLNELANIEPNGIRKTLNDAGIDIRNMIACLPALVAHYLHEKSSYESTLKRANELMDQNKRDDESMTSYLSRAEKGWNLLEKSALIHKFKAALFLERIYHPYREVRLPGIIISEDPAKRFMRKILNKDIYFLFDSGRSAVKLSDAKNLSVHELHRLLYSEN